MADSGGTEGTPIVPGSPTGLSIAEKIKYTWLSLPYYAKILGINPVFFQGATAESIGVFPLGGNRNNDLWPRYSWQDSDRISHEDLARAIYDAEWDIARYTKKLLCPTWIAQEVHNYPVYHRRDAWQFGGLNVRGARKDITLDWSQVISPGQRAVTLIGTASTTGGSLVYSDEDGDGFAETATVELPTTETNACELKVYFSGQGGVQEWEIRPPVSKSITSGTFTAVFRSWLFIDPDVQSSYPTTAGFSAIDIGTTANFVTAVDVYREYNDPTATSVTFFWEPDSPALGNVLICGNCGGTGCTACQLTTQDGCFHIRDANLGTVVPTPATYSATNGTWGTNDWTVCRDPDLVRLYYYAGNQSNESLASRTCDCLDNWWAKTISWLATARLERPFCAGTNILSLTRKWQRDLALTGEISQQITESDLSNPFGTRFGEVMAWKRISQLARKRMTGVAI